MIFDLIDEQVEIIIPEFVSKLKPEILEEFKKKYDSNEMLEQLKNVSENQHYQKKVETIGIWMSGGADSSLLAYILAKKIKDDNLNIKIQPLSVRRGRGWNPIYAGNVIDFIEQDLNIKMKNHIVYYPPMDDEHYREIEVFREKDNENFLSDLFQILYSGITCNPPSDDPTISKNKERTRDEESDRPLITHNGIRYYMNPFFGINKKKLKMIYDQLKLTDTLFSITRSCEGSDYETGNYTYHCKKCWWCEERYWAFGKYV